MSSEKILNTMAKFTLPAEFLSGPAPNLIKRKVEFTKTPIPEYDGLYAVVLDGCFSKEECDLLVQAAEARAGGVWEKAMVNVGGGHQVMATDTRNCGRIIWDDRDMVAKIWARVADKMTDIAELKNKRLIMGNGPIKWKEVYQMTRLNERMRFLKYGEGQYFRPHCDGAFATEDNEEISFYTLHLYLNEADPDGNPLEGGATAFHHPYDDDVSFDVVPKVGRILIFQHKYLVHSGAEVYGGTKLTLRTDIMFKLAGHHDDEDVSRGALSKEVVKFADRIRGGRR